MKILNMTPKGSIQLLTADSNYTVLTLNNGKKIMSSYCLNVFANLFDDHNFIRVNRSNMVRPSFIRGTKTSSSGQYFLLKNNIELLIPRRRKPELFDQFPFLFENHNAS